MSIVDPDFETYSEENPQDIPRGESFAAEVIKHVMSGPAWPHTLLIWLYDENGGYYDHAPPPEAVPPDDAPAHNYILDLPRWLRTLLSPVFGGGFARLKAIEMVRATTPVTASGCRPWSSPRTPGLITCAARRWTTPRCSS